MHKASDLHAHLARAIEDLRDLAGQVDSNGRDRVLDQLTQTNDLTEATAFLQRAHELLINVAETLTMVIRMHRTYGDSSGLPDFQHHAKALVLTLQDLITVDAAEAWRRAHLHLPRHRDDPILFHIREFEDGYQAIPVLVSIPEPPSVPTIESLTTLVIDKTTGAVTRWPLLPLEVLAMQYRCYCRQEPMIFSE